VSCHDHATTTVLGHVDPHDLIKLLRWKRKKKGNFKKNKNKSYVKGKVIDGEHELYTMSIAVMIGVRTSISRTNAELNSGPGKRWVRASDFRTTEKYEFRPKGDGPLPPHQLAHTFKYKDYCPVVFAYMRRMYGINEFDFLLSVCGNANFIEFVSNSKSGQFFFYSSDGRYMIKTMTNAESKFLRRILPQYFKHCCENPNAMLTRFFGMYRVKLYHLRRNVKFVIMNSVYYTDKHLQTFYDLKGSVIGRDAKPGQFVYKDNDLRRTLPEGALSLHPKERTVVRSQLQSDCAFLAEMDVMDYSMLVGVHHKPAFEQKSSATLSFRKSRQGNRNRKNTEGSFVSVQDESETSEAGESGFPRKSSASSAAEEKRLGSSLRSSATPHSAPHSDNVAAHPLEDGLEDDDDDSYLIGSQKHPGSPNIVDEDTERKKLATIEKLFWPFHNWYDIHGNRRMHPRKCPTCGGEPCSKCSEKDSALLVGYKIPKFIPPLSERKDRGFDMDITGLHLPMKLKCPTGDLMYEGKIFYMGIIDVLQEYNSRKAIESTYRFWTAPSKDAASCVPPVDYGQRFLAFFDQYTTRELIANVDEEGVEIAGKD
jgi:1-phosphatidylinositol-4-phosphate 5-kinase